MTEIKKSTLYIWQEGAEYPKPIITVDENMDMLINLPISDLNEGEHLRFSEELELQEIILKAKYNV